MDIEGKGEWIPLPKLNSPVCPWKALHDLRAISSTDRLELLVGVNTRNNSWTAVPLSAAAAAKRIKVIME